MLISLIGTTGVGKSKLSVELAKLFNAEIINADIMQMYRGLPIATNKIPEAERQSVPHHLLDFLDGSEEYKIRQFLTDAVDCIADIESRGRVPIVVGGTHYYIQHLLFAGSLMNSESIGEALVAPLQETEEFRVNCREINQVLDSSAENGQALMNVLERIDPRMAQRWHVNDVRKIRRSLEVYVSSGGRKHSELMEMQRSNGTQNTPRFPRSLVFWLYSKQEELNQRLDKRVDDMCSSGLAQEMQELHDAFADGKVGFRLPDDSPDYTRGVLQAIGFKEFHKYLRLQSDAESQESRGSADKLWADAIERMKITTRQYAKSQISWIKRKLAPLCRQGDNNSSNNENTPYIYLLDATNVDEVAWRENVLEPAVRLARDFLSHSTLPSAKALSQTASEMLTSIDNTRISDSMTWKKRMCDVCDREVVGGEREWQMHLNSRRHRKTETLRRSPQWPYLSRLKQADTTTSP